MGTTDTIKITHTDNGEKTIIHFKGRKMEGIKLPKRSGSGFHNSRPRKQRTRSQIKQAWRKECLVLN